MKQDAVIIQTSGVRCDNPSCDFVDANMNMPTTPEGRRAFVGTPCPKCGASLLTQEDCDTFEALVGLTNAANVLFRNVEIPEDAERVFIPVKMDGSGNVKLGEIESEEDAP